MKYTKEQLAGMSDFEVNKALAELEYPEYAVIRSIAEKDEISIIGNDFGKVMINYCTNPSDIMPLAFEYAIGVETNPIRKDWLARTCSTSMSNMHFRCYIDKNPLRAIACCLILVLQSK